MLRQKIFIFAAVFVIVAVAGFFGYRFYAHSKNATMRTAVFMTNGQVYFGYLSDTDKATIQLKDVYYLKNGDLQSNTNNKILLVKMGNELHSPENSMSINRDQILFWQEIKKDSKINEAITKFNQTNNNPSPSPSPSS